MNNNKGTKIIENVELKKIVEANAVLWVPRAPRIYDAPAFFNPVMGLNRDFSVLANKVAVEENIKKPVFIYEPLGGIGARGIRVLLSLKDKVEKYVSNDINPYAVKIAELNASENKVPLVVTQEDARWQISDFRKENTVFPQIIDLDPFGPPTPFLDALSYGFSRNTFLYVTATDMAPLCGVYPETCFMKYHSYPLRIYQCHEVAIRILISSIALTAARRGYGIEVMFSYSTDHYIRAGIMLKKGKEKAKQSIKKLGFLFYEKKSNAFFVTDYNERIIQNNSSNPSKGEFNRAGPIWTGKLGNRVFLSKMLENIEAVPLAEKNRAQKIIKLLIEENEAPILFYRTDKLSKGLRGGTPSTSIVIEKLKENEFSAYPTHFHPQGVKTNANELEIKEIVQQLLSSNS